jgi:FtsP/CotA-like multicopper oxidase with cupredoxin domain
MWEIRNNSNAAHPFHIHINPFMVVNVNGVAVPLSQRFWQDTVSVPANGFVRFVSRFENFPGKFVLHCHILVHEDWGMMRAVEVIGDGYGPCQKVTTPLPKT